MKAVMIGLPKYDPTRTYLWNYDNAPEPVELDIPALAGNWSFLGMTVTSPLGIPAGPLLNGKWCRYYASLGFDALTYKTVRSRERACYSLPNLQPVAASELADGEQVLSPTNEMRGSWAVSFGMPSKSPNFWRADVEQTRHQLPSNKRLVVSVVGTEQPDWDIDDLAADYAQCARWAVESGADAVELNFSCPNVCTSDGQLYQDPVSAQHVVQVVRDSVPTAPVIIKIGHLAHAADAAALVAAIGGVANALSMVNCITARVTDEFRGRLFDGAPRGIAGEAIRRAAVNQVALFRDEIRRSGVPLELIGVGGIATAQHVLDHLDAGAHSVQIATAAMLNPSIAIQIRSDLAHRKE
jgi:dihydroorotate dehydrogenase (NAD+) catalytic subunit